MNPASTPPVKDATPDIYSFKLKTIDGKPVDLSKYKGKKILIVNVASECGFTPQYTDLEKLYEQYKDKMVIVGIPCNDFGGQEPGSPEEIQQFCSHTYGVTFPIMEKVNIKTEPIAPIYEWLTEKKLNGVEDATVTWNFNKFLIDENGHYVAHFVSKVTPFSDELIAAIKK
jgi:glutathione peroxidase